MWPLMSLFYDKRLFDNSHNYLVAKSLAAKFIFCITLWLPPFKTTNLTLLADTSHLLHNTCLPEFSSQSPGPCHPLHTSYKFAGPLDSVLSSVFTLFGTISLLDYI